LPSKSLNIFPIFLHLTEHHWRTCNWNSFAK